MKLYNTLTMQKEEFVPQTPGKVKMYSCGPTVYNLFHIGNARPLIVFDVLRRYFEHKGLEVTYVQNFTDIDDKIINRANSEGVSCKEIAERYITEYWIDARGLGVKDATIHPKATEHITEIIEMISTLVDNGMAYESNGDVYFRTAAFADYGKLSNQPLDELQLGARIDVSETKESPIDFVLWKKSKEGEPYWESPWGSGRPGWHIECSAMAKKYLGDTIDIHTGGQDLIFPHHENEIAQSEGCNGCEFVRYWLHNGFISIDSKKMSKSKGNFFTVREAAVEYGYDTIRMFMLMSHYRSPLNYSEDVMHGAKAALERIKTAVRNFEFLSKNGSDSLSATEDAFILSIKDYEKRFFDALEDDLNTADAIAVIFELVREGNTIAALDNPSKEFAVAAQKALIELTGVLGLVYEAYANKGSGASPKASEGHANDVQGAFEHKSDGDFASDTEIEALIEKRQKARSDKNWALADSIRDKLGAMGVTIEDTAQGAKWHR